MVASVADRVDRITSKSSPLMKRAKTQGMQQAGRRGLGNSTMGIQAAQAAVIDAATPMAQTDAQLDNQRLMQTRDFGQRDKEQERDLSFRDREFLEQKRQFNAGLGLDRDRLGEDKRQFGLSHGLEKDRLSQQNTQWQQGHTLDRERLDQDKSQFQMGYDLDTRRMDQDQTNADRDYELNQQQFGLQQTQATNQTRATQLQAAQNIENLAAQLLEAAEGEGLTRDQRQNLIDRSNALRESSYALMQQIYPELEGLDWDAIDGSLSGNDEGSENAGGDSSDNTDNASSGNSSNTEYPPLGDGPAPSWLSQLQEMEADIARRRENGTLTAISRPMSAVYNKLRNRYEQYRNDYENYEI